MTNKEAISILKEHYGKRNWCEKTRAEEVLQMAIEALEKQTPKSITEEDCCPTCGASAIKEYESKYDYTYYNYCDNCGQNLYYDI
jgi:hypothetical protein